MKIITGVKSPGRIILMIAAIVVMFAWLKLDDIMVRPPGSIHIWRQTDCLSITGNLYDSRATFFEPEIHNLLSDNYSTGKTAGEFPLLYQFVAMVWKVTGKSEFVYRLIVFLIACLGLISVFRLTLNLTGNTLLSLFAGLLPFASPVFVNYSISFLPNIPAISLTFAGWALFYRYTRDKQTHWLWFTVLLFTLSTLLKVSAGISFVALTGWLVIELVFKRYRNSVFNQAAGSVLPFATGWILILGWYLYAAWFNSIHGGRYTFNSVWPIWELSPAEIRDRLEAARILWKDQLFAHWLLWLSIILWPVLLLFSRKMAPFLRYILIVIPIGTIIYLLFWFQALRDHDYYYIEVIVPVIMNWIMLFYLITRHAKRSVLIISLLTAVILLTASINSRKAMKDRYSGWMNEWYSNNLEAVYKTGTMIDSLDIPDDAIIISIPDPSINSTLYMLNRRGFTDFGSDFSQPGMIDDRISRGADYLVLNDSSLVNAPLISPYTGLKIFGYRNVGIYDLRSYR